MSDEILGHLDPDTPHGQQSHPLEMFSVLGASSPDEAFIKHIELYLSDPEKAHVMEYSAVGGGVQTALLLETTGRKSGEKRLVPIIYKKIDGKCVVVGSKAGAETHPAWALNLMKTPRCYVRVAADQFAADARLTAGEEHDRLMSIMIEEFPPYGEYIKLAGNRELPVFVLEPLSP